MAIRYHGREKFQCPHCHIAYYYFGSLETHLLKHAAHDAAAVKQGQGNALEAHVYLVLQSSDEFKIFCRRSGDRQQLLTNLNTCRRRWR